MPDPAATIRSKLTRRLVAPLTFLTFLNSIDRVNVSFAALQMNRELGLSPEQYGFGVGLFFVGYLTCSFPHTALLQRVGARRWIFGAVLLWGSIATALSLIQNAGQFYVLRVLLGAAESGFAPGIVFIMSQWMPQRFRASSIAGSMLAIPISMILGAPLSGWLLTLHTGLPWSGWRFMFLVEGLVTVAAAFATPALFVDEPTAARWLSSDEKRWLTRELEHERAPAQAAAGRGPSVRSLLRIGPLWAAAAVWFSLMSGTYGIIYWLPQVIKQLSGLGDLAVSALSATPWVGLGAGMLISAWHSDLTQERRWHVALSALLAAAGLLGAALFGQRWPALLCLTAGAFGLGGAQGAFWALPTSLLDRRVAAAGLTLITVFGSAGGLIMPPLIGLARARTGSFAVSAGALALLLCCGAVMVTWMRAPAASAPAELPPGVPDSPGA
jgi:ACS family tartrate transporter-like MFS transporter